MTFVKHRLPRLGAGLGYRGALHLEIAAHSDAIDWLEVIVDQFTPLNGQRQKTLHQISDMYRCVPHSLELSIGSLAGAPAAYSAGVCRFAQLIDAPWFSDHLACNRLPEINLGSFVPPFRDRKSVGLIADRIQQLQQVAQRTFLFENVASVLEPGGSLDEPTFINMIAERADCGILLDLANLYARSLCMGWDAQDFIRQLDLERVVQVHLAGGAWQGGYLRDTHDHPVPDPVWELLTALAEQTEVNAVLIERDADFPDEFGALLSELRRAREIIEGRGAAGASETPPGGRPTSSPALELERVSQADLEHLIAMRAPWSQPEAALTGRDADLGVADEVSRFFDEVAQKRLGFIDRCFPATVGVLLAVMGSMRLLARALLASQPRHRLREEELGMRTSEIGAFMNWAVAKAIDLELPALSSLAEFEAAMALAVAAEHHEAPAARGSVRPDCGCVTDGTGDLLVCETAELGLAAFAVLRKFPFDVIRARAALLESQSPDEKLLKRLAANHQGATVVAVAAAQGSASVARIGEHEFALLRSPADFAERGYGHWTGRNARTLRMALAGGIMRLSHS
jgi:uncharacterized protein